MDIIRVFLPISFIWSTPILAKYGVCRSGMAPFIGHSLSRYISTPQATGMMAVSYFSISNIMISKRFFRAFELSDYSNDYHLMSEEKSSRPFNMFRLTGFIYEAFFGMFLCAPVIWSPTVHSISVIAFSTAAYSHMSLLQHSPNLSRRLDKVLVFFKCTGTTALCGMLICELLAKYNHVLPSHLFWSLECTGLSSFVLFMHIAQIELPKLPPSPIDDENDKFLSQTI